MTTVVGAVQTAGYWNTQTGDPATAPGAGKYQADNWAAPTLLAIAGIDADGHDRQAGLVMLQPGDLITEQGTNDSLNYQRWTVATVTDNGTWVQVAVTVTETGSLFAAPGSNQRRLLELLSLAPPATEAWPLWAPPLDPPTTGGLPVSAAQAIADATWDYDPHLCAALQWEAYAATLPPSAAVSQVATGLQSVTYSPPMPGGDAGAAMARAAWHRSLMGNGMGVEMVQSPPARPTVPGDLWLGNPNWNWWPVA